MTVPIDVTAWLPRPAAKYHGCYPLGFEKYISKWLGTDNYIHLFAGLSKTGFRVDIKDEVKPNLVADCQKLPLQSESFEGGMADPPYTEEFAKTLYGCKYPKVVRVDFRTIKGCKERWKDSNYAELYMSKNNKV